ncbi:MAG: HD domain-containing phosphohydrolase [Phycisphaeraceae bacterium]
MLLCSLDDIESGMVVVSPVLHPHRPDTTLLTAGAQLDGAIIARLRSLGVPQLWVHHDATADLDAVVAPNLTEARLRVYSQIKSDFQRMQGATVCTAQVQRYRRAVMELICELMSRQGTAGLAEQLLGSGSSALFSHCANVCYLSLLAGLELEPYVVRERSRVAVEDARDITNLGLGAMLHDIGKVKLPKGLRDRHEIFFDDSDDDDELEQEYRSHALIGFKMLRGSPLWATSTQVVLCHHQRHNGSGWPEMDELTNNRRKGAQSQGGIHIFARIVAVANVLDNLMRSAEGDRRPPIAALCEMADRRFDGWFDPVIRSAMVRRLPPFPVASQVRLSDGRLAVVVTPNFQQPCRPVVRLLSASEKRPDGSFPLIDLEAVPELEIIECAGMDVQRWLFELPPVRHVA